MTPLTRVAFPASLPRCALEIVAVHQRRRTGAAAVNWSKALQLAQSIARGFSVRPCLERIDRTPLSSQPLVPSSDSHRVSSPAWVWVWLCHPDEEPVRGDAQGSC